MKTWLVFCSLIFLSHCSLSDLICIWLVSFEWGFPHLLSDLIPPGACNLLNSSTIYANNEVDLAEVDIYGFDYDYTLALYSNALNTMIFNTARGFLIEHFKVCFTDCCITYMGITTAFRFRIIYSFCPPAWQYPEGIGKYDYIPNFAVRGLHYDIQKVNSFKSKMSRCRKRILYISLFR